MKSNIILIVTIFSLIGGCTSAHYTRTSTAERTICQEPRPQVCTMDYRPVCATLEDGAIKTYANGCGACADTEVVSWVDNACPE